MGKKVLLINESQIKNQSVLDNAVDSKVLSKTILACQEIELRSILGTTLYNSVIDAVYDFVNSGTTMTDIQTDLLNNYIQPYLIHEVVTSFIVVNNYRIGNKGVLKLRDDVGENVNGSELEFVRTYYANLTTRYKNNLIQFIKENNLIDSCSVDTTTTGTIGWFLNK